MMADGLMYSAAADAVIAVLVGAVLGLALAWFVRWLHR